MRLLLIGCALALATFATAQANDDEAEERTEGDAGHWKVVAAEHDGDPLERIVAGCGHQGQQLSNQERFSGTELKGDLALKPAKKPKHFDYVHQEGPLKDKKWEGIYELKGDTRKICYAEADSERSGRPMFKTLRTSACCTSN